MNWWIFVPIAIAESAVIGISTQWLINKLFDRYERP